MAGKHSGLWVGFTFVLTVVFAVLFFPAVHAKYTLTESLACTAVGVIVIWGVYFARAAIFTRLFARGKPSASRRDVL